MHKLTIYNTSMFFVLHCQQYHIYIGTSIWMKLPFENMCNKPTKGGI